MPPPLPSRTNWTRLVPRPVLTGHVSPLQVFCLGESAILSIVGWICTMPVLVLAARLCPEVRPRTLRPSPLRFHAIC